MKLPFFNKSAGNGTIYLGLFLKEREGIGMVMGLRNSNLNLDNQEKFTYSNGWDNLTEDIDQVILKLERGTDLRLSETIFFVYSHFIDEKTREIKQVYLEKIKTLVKKLNLKALGYIECYEAIKHFLEKKEEIPLTAVLIELDTSNISVFVYKRGELNYSKTLFHTDNIIDDLMTCFIQIKGKILLPSRIILYNSKDLDSESTEIVTNRWSEELFIQLPKVEIIQEHELTQGLLGVFGEQIGKKTYATKFEEERLDEVLGFKIGGDVGGEKARNDTQTPTPISSIVSNMFTSLSGKLKTIPNFINKKWTIALGIILIILGVILNEYLFHKASLTLFLPFQAIKEEIELTSNDIAIKSAVKTTELRDEKSTSGRLEIGEESRGSVSIHNFDDKEKSFTKGTILEGSGIKFSLDMDVKVASASVITINGGLVKQPGKSKANITASEIGPQGNLSSGKQFTIDDFPSNLYFAINDSAMSGGTKKEVKTVAKKDMDDLKKGVLELAKKQKLDQTELEIIPQLTEIRMDETNFDREVGEEADKLKLQAKVRITAYSYDVRELKKMLTSNLLKSLKKGYLIEEDKLSYKLKDTEKTDDKISITTSVDAKAIKDIAKEDIVKKVRGRNINSVKNILKKNYEVEAFRVDIEPELPILGELMPFFEKNINLKVSSE